MNIYSVTANTLRENTLKPNTNFHNCVKYTPFSIRPYNEVDFSQLFT